MTDCTPITQCLICGSTELEPVLDLGEQPLANDFRAEPVDLPKYPLALNVCTKCWHGQLSVGVDPKVLFKDYAYQSGTSETLKRYFQGFALRVAGHARSQPLSILEIGGNDGTLATELLQLGHKVCVVDPAENLRRNLWDNCIVGFWNHDTADMALFNHGPFDVVIAMNVLPHVEDPVKFMELANLVLRPTGGRIYVQTSQARYLVQGQFDVIYHEHRSYFSVSSFRTLADRVQLRIADIDLVPIHGESYLVSFDPTPGPHYIPAVHQAQIDGEKLDWYRHFAMKAEHRKSEMLPIIDYYRRQGDPVIGYGAAAKGMTFLGYTGIELDYLVDDAALKIGKMAPCGNVVETPQNIGYMHDRALFLILGWNFCEEIIGRIKAIRDNPEDRFLVAFPELRVFS